MQVKTIEIPYSWSEEFHLYTPTDDHMGTKHHAGKALAKQIEEIKKDKRGLWIHLGDKGEFIVPKDPRYDIDVIEDWVKQSGIAKSERNRWCEVYEPIQKQCIGLLEGNHEDALRIHSNTDVQEEICEQFKATDLGYSCFIRFIFHRKNSKESHSFTGYFTHGSGCAITKGAKLNRLERIMEAFDADLYALGHMHDLITDSKPYLTLDGRNRIKQKEKVGAVAGCYFTTYSQGIRASYGEKKNYPPTAVGTVMFTIKPLKGEITVSVA